MISTSATDHKMFGLFHSFESQIESFLGSVKKKKKKRWLGLVLDYFKNVLLWLWCSLCNHHAVVGLGHS